MPLITMQAARKIPQGFFTLTKLRQQKYLSIMSLEYKARKQKLFKSLL